MKKIFVLILFIGVVDSLFAQTTNIQVQVNNGSYSSGSSEYTINGIPKSQDIGGVDITAQQETIEFGFLAGGFAYNGMLPIINGVTLTNYNSRPVTVILQLHYKANIGRKPYPRYYDEEEKILTVVIPGAGDPDRAKYIALPPSGTSFVTEIVSADMIVRPLQ